LSTHQLTTLSADLLYIGLQYFAGVSTLYIVKVNCTDWGSTSI